MIIISKREKKEDPDNFSLLSLTSIPENMMKRIILEIIFKDMKIKKMTVSFQCEFTNLKPGLTNEIAFYDELIGSVHEGRGGDVIYLYFIKTCPNILLDHLMKYKFNKWTVRGIENLADPALVSQIGPDDLQRTPLTSAIVLSTMTKPALMDHGVFC